MIDLPKNKKLILFDGFCNLCNNSVIEVIKNDTNNMFVFSSLQSENGRKIIDHLNIDVSKTDSIILYEAGISYDIKSTAALKIMNDFGGFWKLTNLFWIFPTFLRDISYSYIAKNRYKWFGKKETCMIPTPALKAKFLP